MKASEIDRALRSFGLDTEYFSGVYSFNVALSILLGEDWRGIERFLVINTEEEWDIGKHWFVVYVNPKHSVPTFEIFDSIFGLNNKIIDHLYKIGPCIINETQLQSNESTSCSLFCIFYICTRVTNFDLDYCEHLSAHFHSSSYINERIVKDFFHSMVTENYA